VNIKRVEVKLCPSVESENEIFILCKSKDRALKEQAIHDRFVLRIEKGLEKIKRTCDQRKGKDITHWGHVFFMDGVLG
jgi:hypothetical protein